MRFEYEFHDDSGQWYRAYSNENWEFDELGYMKRRFASINDLPIQEAARSSDGKGKRKRLLNICAGRQRDFYPVE